MRKLAPFLVVSLLSVAPLVAAHAADVAPYKPCPGKPSQADENAARGLFQAGKTAYEEADYAKALAYWRDAYDRDCTAHPLLINLANAYEKSGQLDAAIMSLETFLKRAPSDPDAPTIQKRIENMRKLRAQPTTSAPPPATTTAPPPATTAAPPATTPASTSSAAPGAKNGRGIAPWIVVGAGGALLVAGTIVYLGGASKVSDADQACPTHIACPGDIADKGNSGRTQEKVGVALDIVGVAAVGGGLAWYFLAQPKPGEAAKTWFTPEAGHGYAGMRLGGSF